MRTANINMSNTSRNTSRGTQRATRRVAGLAAAAVLTLGAAACSSDETDPGVDDPIVVPAETLPADPALDTLPADPALDTVPVDTAVDE